MFYINNWFLFLCKNICEMLLQHIDIVPNQVNSVTNYYYSSIPVTNEPHLASRESKSCLISGGDSS